MKNDEIENWLTRLKDQQFSLEQFRDELQGIKEAYVRSNDQPGAKQVWIYQSIVDIHTIYVNCFRLIKEKKYYEAWCQLERIEIELGFLKKHFAFDKRQYSLWLIERSVKNLQVIYPYRMFSSSEILKKREKCSVCDREISIRTPCEHIIGEIYNGEMCHRIVTEAVVLGISLVENPGNKYSVMFLTDGEEGEQTDHYDYTTIEYLFNIIEEPYEVWDLEVSQREINLSDYGNAERNSLCPCGSGKKFKKCCLSRVGEKIPHFEFLLVNPSSQKLLANTVKHRLTKLW